MGVVCFFVCFTSSCHFNHEAGSWQLHRSMYNAYDTGKCLACGKLYSGRFPDSLFCLGWALHWPALGCKQELSTRKMMEWKAFDFQNLLSTVDGRNPANHLRCIKP